MAICKFYKSVTYGRKNHPIGHHWVGFKGLKELSVHVKSMKGTRNKVKWLKETYVCDIVLP